MVSLAVTGLGLWRSGWSAGAASAAPAINTSAEAAPSKACVMVHSLCWCPSQEIAGRNHRLPRSVYRGAGCGRRFHAQDAGRFLPLRSGAFFRREPRALSLPALLLLDLLFVVGRWRFRHQPVRRFLLF